MFIQKLKKRIIELKAGFWGKIFYCRALAGESDYNIVINSDMTVSCNCQDWDGSGRIGNLDKHNLNEIFAGEKSNSIRKSLSQGKLPILTCINCIELKETDKNFVHNYSVPYKGIQVENTSNCNLGCKYCKRELIEQNRRKNSLSLEDLEKISTEIKKHNIQRVYFFNLGEPFLSKNICEELKILKEANTDLEIIVSTNGVFLDSEEKREAALQYIDHIYFSIDGINNETLKKYQRNGNFEKAYKNMETLTKYRDSNKKIKPIIEWKYVVFSWNDREEYINQAIKLAKEAKINTITFWKGDAPFWAKSWRYKLGFFDKIGEKSWKGREVVLI